MLLRPPLPEAAALGPRPSGDVGPKLFMPLALNDDANAPPTANELLLTFVLLLLFRLDPMRTGLSSGRRLRTGPLGPKEDWYR